jgi:hypothetical protein
VSAPVKFGEGGNRGQFFLHKVHSAGTREGVLKPLGGVSNSFQAKGGGAVKTGGADEVGPRSYELPPVSRLAEERKSTSGIPEPEEGVRRGRRSRTPSPC